MFFENVIFSKMQNSNVFLRFGSLRKRNLFFPCLEIDLVLAYFTQFHALNISPFCHTARNSNVHVVVTCPVHTKAPEQKILWKNIFFMNHPLKLENLFLNSVFVNIECFGLFHHIANSHRCIAFLVGIIRRPYHQKTA